MWLSWDVWLSRSDDFQLIQDVLVGVARDLGIG